MKLLILNLLKMKLTEFDVRRWPYSELRLKTNLTSTLLQTIYLHKKFMCSVTDLNRIQQNCCKANVKEPREIFFH